MIDWEEKRQIKERGEITIPEKVTPLPSKA